MIKRQIKHNYQNNPKKQFKRFLKRNNAFAKFESNIIRKGEHNSFESYMDDVESLPILFLTLAFPWAISKEGWDSWAKLNIKWRKKLEYYK